MSLDWPRSQELSMAIKDACKLVDEIGKYDDLQDTAYDYNWTGKIYGKPPTMEVPIDVENPIIQYPGKQIEVAHIDTHKYRRPLEETGEPLMGEDGEPVVEEVYIPDGVYVKYPFGGKGSEYEEYFVNKHPDIWKNGFLGMHPHLLRLYRIELKLIFHNQPLDAINDLSVWGAIYLCREVVARIRFKNHYGQYYPEATRQNILRYLCMRLLNYGDFHHLYASFDGSHDLIGMIDTARDDFIEYLIDKDIIMEEQLQQYRQIKGLE